MKPVGRVGVESVEGIDVVDDDDIKVMRAKCEYKNLSDRFMNCSKDFSKQYAHIYAARLASMHDNLLKRVKVTWGNKYPVRKLHELREEKEETCIIIGTLYKHQELKPSILKELSDELEIVPQPQRNNFVEDKDYLILEDELQRIRLFGNVIDVSKVVTGVVCAVLGYEEVNGSFKIIEVCWPECSPQRHLASFDDDRYIVIASGLNFSSVKDNLFAIQLFSDWICGVVGGKTERTDTAKIVRLIIAGNSVCGAPSDSNGTVINAISSSIAGPGFDSLDAITKLDSLLDTVCYSLPVDLMPGEFDPTNIMLPQKPMHYCMFPKALKVTTFNGVPNPYEFEIGGRNVCGSSGQPVDDILRYSSLSSHLDALRSTLLWGHIAPTAPDTLPCVPSHNIDPFVLENCPDIYFTGNCEKFETELYEGKQGQKVRLVCVPSFATTRTVVIVNLKTLDCIPMTFMYNLKANLNGE